MLVLLDRRRNAIVMLFHMDGMCNKFQSGGILFKSEVMDVFIAIL